jgi:hypothetical protein|uniref:Uncharacterized protein n=1 Tax=Myoviridae sp. ctbwh6 TaxID=2827611 RepID=A0A8S5LI71_9CAUD|nr:MAG TPA: hypothetical protein [Myoviridae sp. ctbwh6]
MAYDVNKLAQLAHLKQLAQKVKQECASQTSVTELTTRVKSLEDVGAQANVIEKVKVNGAEQTVTDKAVDITVPTKVSDLSNDSKFQTDAEVAAAIAAADHMKRKIVNSTADIDLTAGDASQYIYMVKKSSTKTGDKYDEYMVLDGALEKVGDWEVDLSNYVQKDGDKVLSTNDFTNELLEKLNGIEAGANKYTHAVHDAHASGFYKVTVDAEGHVTAVAAVEKADITALGIPGENTQYVVATAESDGLMSKEDKAKLDGFVAATEAEVTEMLNEVFAAK